MRNIWKTYLLKKAAEAGLLEHIWKKDLNLIIQSYLNRLNKEKFSIDYIKESIEELKQFMTNLMEYNITIYKTSNSN
jgi:hypothetical protein